MSWLLPFSEVVRNLGLVIAAGIGIYLAWRRVSAATRQPTPPSSRRSWHGGSTSPTCSIVPWGSSPMKLEIRLGAVYTLRQIARDFPDLSGPTFELLSTYLKESAARYGDHEPPVDVREIMNIIKDYVVQG